MKSTFSGFVKNMGDAVASATDAASTAVDTSLAVAKNAADKAGHSALEFGKSAGEAMGDAAQSTSDFASRTGKSISESAAKSLVAAKHGVDVVGDSAAAGAKSAGNVLGALGVLVGDLNGDGKVDFEDAKIAASKVRDVTGAAAAELGQLGKNALQSKLVQDAAAGAMVGGVLASMIPIPIISTVTGATAGAALGAYKSIGKK